MEQSVQDFSPYGMLRWKERNMEEDEEAYEEALIEATFLIVPFWHSQKLHGRWPLYGYLPEGE
jgi:hypothetical protein